MVLFLIRATFRGAVHMKDEGLITGQLLLKSAALVRGWCLFETQHLLEEIWYTFFRIFNFMNLAMD